MISETFPAHIIYMKAMIKRYYKVYCDYCGDLLAEFDHKPTREDLERKNLYTTATKVFCSAQCNGDWNHDLQETRYMNLTQKGRIHTNG